MSNQDKKQEPKTAMSEDYDINHPENLNTPAFNSTTEHRKSDEVPSVENLNHQDGPVTQNDKPLHGEKSKTDLGNGKRDDDEKENEKIIRT